jgi:hypothetical protein
MQTINITDPEQEEALSFTYLGQVDTAAGEARLRYLTNIPAQDATYTAKRKDAKRFVDDGYPVESLHRYPWVKGDMDAYKTTAIVAVDTILRKAEVWEAVGVTIETIRLKAKKAIREACSVKEKHIIATAAIRQLSEI